VSADPRRALGLLARAERRELDRGRQALAAADGALGRTADALAGIDGRFGAELGLALALPDGPRLAAAFAAGHRARRAALAAERGRLLAERARLEATVRERAVALRTLELAEDELRARAEEAAARADQRRLDDAAVVRHAVAAGRGRSELGG
jgi:hypothetical protein